MVIKREKGGYELHLTTVEADTLRFGLAAYLLYVGDRSSLRQAVHNLLSEMVTSVDYHLGVETDKKSNPSA